MKQISQKQPWTRFTQELVIRIAYTKVNLLSFMRNISIYSLYFKERHTPNSLQRYCTNVYTVKAKRAIQITHTNTHNSPHTQALNINAACRCCISANHTRIQQKASRETSKIHGQRHLFISNWWAVPEKRLFLYPVRSKYKANSADREKNMSAVECLRIRLGCGITQLIISLNICSVQTLYPF